MNIVVSRRKLWRSAAPMRDSLSTLRKADRMGTVKNIADFGAFLTSAADGLLHIPT
jgi:ribosomal protein S1